MTPTVPGIPGPYRFFFYSFDCNEPRHIHVQRGGATCEFWIEPLALARNHGFAAHELNKIIALIRTHSGRIFDAWDRHYLRR
jgi:hypothetical protein